MNALPLIDDRFEVYRVIAPTDNPEDVWEAMREGFADRVEDMGVTRLAIDEAGNFTGGHSSKILCTPPIKRLGEISLSKMMKSTGMVLVLAIDDERFRSIYEQMEKRKRPARSIQAKSKVKPVNIEELVKKALSERIQELRKTDSSAKRKARRHKQRARQRRATHAARKRWEKVMK